MACISPAQASLVKAAPLSLTTLPGGPQCCVKESGAAVASAASVDLQGWTCTHLQELSTMIAMNQFPPPEMTALVRRSRC